jgi:hypothetical protein
VCVLLCTSSLSAGLATMMVPALLCM